MLESLIADIYASTCCSIAYYILFAQSDYERDSLHILIKKIDEIVLGLHNQAQEQIKIIFHTTSINCNIWT
mgnify:FL=1